VFDRQWLLWQNAEDMACRNQLAAIVNDSESPVSSPDFEEVVIKCQGMLGKIMMGMSKPFLMRAAEKVCQNIEANCTAPTLNAAQAQSQIMSASENDVPSDDVCLDAVEKLADGQLSNGATSAVQGTGSSIAGQSGSSHPSASVSAHISSEDDIYRPSTEWRKKHMGRAAGKTAWSTVEEELVYKGVLAHGMGNWALIRNEFVPNRTNVDIKDKWRTMKRQGRLQALAAKFGPLPADCLC